MILIKTWDGGQEISVHRSGLLALRAFDLVYFDTERRGFYLRWDLTMQNVYDMLGCMAEDFK